MNRFAILSLALVAGFASAEDPCPVFESLSDSNRAGLVEGETVVLPHRPDKRAEDEPDERFVTVARLIEGDRATIWEVINDKEDAETFLDGVLESREIERGERHIVVEQRTRVGGPKGDYLYTLRHTLQPMERADFTYVKGEIRNVIGSWWICESPREGCHLVIYSLHIDPGIYAPQFIVKRGMKKSMPGTISCIEREVRRRSEQPDSGEAGD